MEFMSDNYMLKGELARRLYGYAAELPIFDYHCHLSPAEIYGDKVFNNITELWLDGDHYKWRVMRAYGADERLVTGGGDAYERFEAFCCALPSFIGNPVYHWAHMELKKYFGITLPVNAENAKIIWDKTLEAMSDGSFSARRLIARSNVECVITTDDPCDSLEYHAMLAKENLSFKVLPCFRPDRAINIEKEDFAQYVALLGKASGVAISDIDDLISALKARLDYFMNSGCAAADIAFTDFPKEGSAELARRAFAKKMRGEKLEKDEEDAYKFEVLTRLAGMFFERKIVMQLHAGVMRNCNGKLFAAAGADAGGDSLANAVDVAAAQKLLDKIEREYGLPKTIIYTLNPNSYYPLATLLGDFWGGERGKLQLGAAWWFMDHRDGIREQLRITANTGGLGLFNGMLTDSRSFVSYARHDYFRRILCSLVAEWAEDGEYPDDENGLRELIFNVCIGNARRFFGGDR